MAERGRTIASRPAIVNIPTNLQGRTCNTGRAERERRGQIGERDKFSAPLPYLRPQWLASRPGKKLSFFHSPSCNSLRTDTTTA